MDQHVYCRSILFICQISTSKNKNTDEKYIFRDFPEPRDHKMFFTVYNLIIFIDIEYR